MSEMYVFLETIDDVKKFVSKISMFDAECDLVSGRYVIDAKSILGIFSIDLTKPVLLKISAEGSTLEEIKEAVKVFEAKV